MFRVKVQYVKSFFEKSMENRKKTRKKHGKNMEKITKSRKFSVYSLMIYHSGYVIYN